MDDSLTMGDILMGAVALFLAYKIYTLLGQRSTDEGESPPPRSGGSEGGNDKMPLVTGLGKIQQKDPAFQEPVFLAGAKGAFELILRAFLKGDRGALKPLVTPAVFTQFEALMKERERLHQEAELTHFRLISASILESDVVDNQAHITVLFKSEQTLLVQSQDALVEGSPDVVEEMQDIWTFSRFLTGGNPHWLLERLEQAEEDQDGS